LHILSRNLFESEGVSWRSGGIFSARTQERASFLEEFCKPESGNFLYVIKGGPGCGKSSFMKTIGQAAEDAGLDVEYVICSGDPDSLDGVLIPAWHVGYADGTSPHILDVALPAASGAYLDLGQFYDVAALRPKREVLADLTAKYRAQYAIAYKALAEAKRLHDDLEAIYNPHVNFDGVYALAKEHILRLQTEN
jgi:hypothetical protein